MNNKKLCVKIAKDVLLQLERERYEAGHTYLGLKYSGENITDNWNEPSPIATKNAKRSLKEFFKKDKKLTCRVCALGSAFMSLVNIENKCTVKRVRYGDIDFHRLKRVFGDRNMSLMETAFELNVFEHGNGADRVELQAAQDFGSRYRMDKQRLTAIMRNIVKNNGDFKLSSRLIARAQARLFPQEA